MDSELLALIERAETGLRQLLHDLRQRPGTWEERARALVALQEIAAGLVEVSRRYAEQLSQEAGER
jgi:hypothetical protein